MKFNKLFFSLFVCATLAVSSNAFAEDSWSWTGTLADWQTKGTVIDGDTDVAFSTLASGTNFDPTAVNVSITEISVTTPTGEHDVYTVGFDFGAVGYKGNGGFIDYFATNLSSEGIDSIRLDSLVTDSVEQVTKKVTSANGLNLLLVSNSGNAVGPISFSPQQAIQILDTLNANGGAIQHVDNQITTVPEPETLAMFGIGLFGILLSAKRRQQA